MRVFGCGQNPQRRNESEQQNFFKVARPCASNSNRSAAEHVCCDPKDGELCLHRAKPEETLVEARSDSDVQIDRQMWV